jgi:hypothetical protein
MNIICIFVLQLTTKAMATRNSRPRTQDNHIFVDYNNKRFMLEVGAFQVKSIVYSIKKKLLSGKLDYIINKINNGDRTILINCVKQIDGDLKFIII